MIGKPVEATLDLLRALRWFFRNPFSKRRDDLSFSLAEQSYAAHISASHRAHISLSYNHLLAIRETVWILVPFNFLKEREDLKGRSGPEAWKIRGR